MDDTGDATIKKVQSKTSPRSDEGKVFLADGKHVAMRMWDSVPPSDDDPLHSNDYETVGYAVSGRAELTIAGQTVRLEPGDSWLVPANAEHRYTILESFTAIEATSPPAHVKR